MTWLVSVDYADGGTTRTLRWNDGNSAVNLTGKTPLDFNGEYVPWQGWSVEGEILSSGSRMEKREWVLSLSDPDFAHRRRWASKWMGKKARLALVAQPGNVFFALRSGVVVSRETLIDSEDGRTLRLHVGSPLRDPVGSTRKRYSNDAFQRAEAKRIEDDEDFVDDSLEHAQRKLTVNWGGYRPVKSA